VIYHYSSSDIVHKYLDYYIKAGIVELILWKIPDCTRKKIHYFGQLVAINDCFYRHFDQSEHIVFCDLDEFITPTKQLGHWSNLLKYYSDSNVSSLNIRNRFFDIGPINPVSNHSLCDTHSKWKHDLASLDPPIDMCKFPADIKMIKLTDNELYDILYYNIQPLLYPIGDTNCWIAKWRSKIIVKRLGPLQIGIHFVHTTLPGYRRVEVNTSLAYLHHYRKINRNMSKYEQKCDTRNSFLIDYSVDILQNIITKHRIIDGHSSYSE